MARSRLFFCALFARSFVAGSTLFLTCAGLQSTAEGAYHLWYIQEAYSNPSGSVQFIELFTNSDGQESLNSFGIAISSNTNGYSFPNDTPSPTGGHSVLLATAGFASLPGGTTPDYTIPSNFFSAAADSIDFGGGIDTKTFENMPTDGVHSLNFDGPFSAGTVATNAPRNYAGQGGSLNLGTAGVSGDYNGNGRVDMADYVLWRNGGPLQNEVSTPNVVDASDYAAWRARFGNTSAAGSSLVDGTAVPEPSAALVSVALLAAGLKRRR
jgi:hypothetical protein